MKYISTRGGISPVSFQQAVMLGQADDGGLIMPQHIPDTKHRNEVWRGLSFVELGIEIVTLYGSDIAQQQWSEMLKSAYSRFSKPNVVSLVELEQFHVLELFHGPTLAFKDVALQPLGELFEHLLKQSGTSFNILGATSGDTGSAAIAAVKGRDRITIFVLYPNHRTSELQELQMTGVQNSNVHCLAIDGSFDDCQNIIKSIFANVEVKRRLQLGAVNSINWARLMFQIVYYYFVSLRFNEPIDVSVPTGNFGNVLSGLIAKRMGAPIDRLFLGTNENDILYRFFSSGVYCPGRVQQTTSPSMDIQVASNLERYLFLLTDCDAKAVCSFMTLLERQGEASLPDGLNNEECIVPQRVDMKQVDQVIRKVWQDRNYIVDPHTAIGVATMQSNDSLKPKVCLATAHPAKFPDVIARAIGIVPPTHPTLESLRNQDRRKTVLPASANQVLSFIEARV